MATNTYKPGLDPDAPITGWKWNPTTGTMEPTFGGTVPASVTESFTPKEEKPYDPYGLQGLRGNDLRNYYLPGGAGNKDFNWTDDKAFVDYWRQFNPDIGRGMGNYDFAKVLELAYPTDDRILPPPGGIGGEPPKDPPKLERTPFGEQTPYQSSYDPSLYNQPLIPFQKVGYQSSFDPATIDAANKLALERAKLSSLPGLQEALAGAREDAARAGGGEATGKFSEFSRKPLEEFSRTLATKGLELEESKIKAQLDDQIAKNNWEMNQAVKAGDFEAQQKLQIQQEALEAKREDLKAKAAWEMEQDVKEKDWVRGETTKFLGAEYTQAQNDYEWERQNAWDEKRLQIEMDFKNKVIDKDEAFNRWKTANDERLSAIDFQRQQILFDMKVAHDNNLADKEYAYNLQLKQLDKEAAKVLADAQEEAAMWEGIGSLFGNAVGAAATIATLSDRRLKKNIKRISTHLLGIGVYEFNYLWDNIKHIGVMADEVRQVKPEAVSTIHGFDMVDYSLL